MSFKTHTLPPIRVDEELYNQVTQAAEALELPVAEIVRSALRHYCQPDQPAKVPVFAVTGGQEDALIWEQVKKVFQGVAA